MTLPFEFTCPACGSALEPIDADALRCRADGTKYRLTRADQTQNNFDKDFVLLSMVDTNGVRTDFTYQGGRIQTVRDDKKLP